MTRTARITNLRPEAARYIDLSLLALNQLSGDPRLPESITDDVQALIDDTCPDSLVQSKVNISKADRSIREAGPEYLDQEDVPGNDYE